MPAFKQLYEASGWWNEHWGRVRTLAMWVGGAGAVVLVIGGILVRQFGPLGAIAIAVGGSALFVGLLSYVLGTVLGRRDERAEAKSESVEAVTPPAPPDRVALLREEIRKLKALREILAFRPIPDDAEATAEQAKKARRATCERAKGAWEVLNEHYEAHEAAFYGPGDRALGGSLFFMSCEQEIRDLGGDVDAYLERKIAYLEGLLPPVVSDRPRNSPAPHSVAPNVRDAFQRRLHFQRAEGEATGAGFSREYADAHAWARETRAFLTASVGDKECAAFTNEVWGLTYGESNVAAGLAYLDRLLERADSVALRPSFNPAQWLIPEPPPASARYLDEDQVHHRGQVLSLVYPMIDEIESYADFEIDGQIRARVSGFERRARGVVKGKFHFWADRLCSDAEAERILREGTKAELLALVKSYTRAFDNP